MHDGHEPGVEDSGPGERGVASLCGADTVFGARGVSGSVGPGECEAGAEPVSGAFGRGEVSARFFFFAVEIYCSAFVEGLMITQAWKYMQFMVESL